MSASQIASKFGVGRTVVSKIVQKRVEELQAQTISFHSCHLICFIPFLFHGRECCAVAGVDEHRKKYLLNIHRNHSPHLIDDFASKSNHFQDDVDAYFCKPEPMFAREIKQVLTGTANQYHQIVAILHHCIRKQIQKINKDSNHNDSLKYLLMFEELLASETSKTFPDAFQSWYYSINSEIYSDLKPLIDAVQQCISEYANTTEYDPEETDFSRLLELIQKYVNDNAPFDTMVYRLLYANPDAVTPSNTVILHQCATHMYESVTGSLTDFGVEIDRLYEEIMYNL